jgi:4-amino-4-deoxy-L-arabinose transferase-like glycosyltransferase
MDMHRNPGIANHKSFALSKDTLLTNNIALFFAWLILTLVNISYHHLIPLDETRYASVAWEMWISHDFLVPHLNGLLYAHKPPLLFWLFNAGWQIFGVNEVWVLLVSPLCALGCLYLTSYLARLLWPDNINAVRLAPWLLFGSLIWCAFLNSVMFDMLLTAWVLLALIGMVKAAHENKPSGWFLLSFAIGMGLLTKGPVMFVHILVPFLAGFLWHENIKNNPKCWYGYGTLALFAGLLIALAWVIPAISTVGEEVGLDSLKHQTVDRTIHSFAHKRSFWWYLMLSPVLFFPWFFWPRAWRQLSNRSLLSDLQFRFCLFWFAGAFLGFSMISGKQVHYLIPLFPALALMLSRSLPTAQKNLTWGDFIPYGIVIIIGLALLLLPYLSGIRLYHWVQNRQLWWPVCIILIGLAGLLSLTITRKYSPFKLALAMIALVTISLIGFFDSEGHAFHLNDAAYKLEKEMQAGHPVAWMGKYDGQFQFLMRLKQPMEIIPYGKKTFWLRQHPDGRVVSIQPENAMLKPGLKLFYEQGYREEKLWIESLL